MSLQVDEVTDDDAIAELLLRQREWSMYGLCDLEPPFRSNARYIGAGDGDHLRALVLAFSFPGLTSLIPFGESEALRILFGAAKTLPEKAVYQSRSTDLPALETRYVIESREDMYRMILEPPDFQPVQTSYAALRSLTPADAVGLERLYRHWETTVFFDPAMPGVNIGAFCDAELVAVSRTHCTSARFGIAAVGGVFTHPDHRGHGLAAATTSLLVEELSRQGIADIQLNVRQDNPAAIRSYGKLGFRTAGTFVEGSIRLKPARAS
jgi:ribosomal protein S18 acetylase RimI-like enzyme